MIEYALRIPMDQSPNPKYIIHPLAGNLSADEARAYAEGAGPGVSLLSREMPDWVHVP